MKSSFVKGWLVLVTLKMKYVVERKKNGHLWRYWIPKAEYIVGGKLVECPFRVVRLVDHPGWVNQAMQLNDELDKWRKGIAVARRHVPQSTGWLIAEYKRDQRYRDLAPATQKLYGYMLNLLEELLGDIPFKDVSRQQARDIYNGFSHTKRKASQVVQVGRVLFGFAKDMEWLDQNPFEKMKVKKPKPRRMIVPAAAIEDAKAKAIEMGLKSVAYAIQIAYDAGQRPGDIRKLSRRDYDGKWLRVVQSKTGAAVDIPVFKMPTLKSMLDQLGHASTLILLEERTGRSFSKDMLCRRVREVFKAAGIGGDIQFRDLRRTAVVRLAEAGCEIPEICAITGHSLEEATQILEVYLPRTRKMAENAIDKVQKLKPH